MAGHNWHFCKIGGMTRINILSGNDIAHLGELDKKLWTVIGCPVSGLEFNGDTLALLDSDGDGIIHAHEVQKAAGYLTSALVNPDILLNGEDTVAVSDFNPDTPEGAQLKESCGILFSTLGSQSDTVSLKDASDALAILKEQAVDNGITVAEVLPYGEDSAAAEEAFNAIACKIDDWFIRCRLASFSTESCNVLDVSAEKLGGISDRMLPECMDEIKSYPIAHVSPDGRLPLDGHINPAWSAEFASLKKLVLDKDFPSAESISEEDWSRVKANIASYVAFKAAVQEQKDNNAKARDDNYTAVSRLRDFLILCRDFFKFLNNYVTLGDFYSRDPQRLSMFQAGSLYIDQRCCDLCIKVSDMARHNDTAGQSGMFLIYCNCTSNSLKESMTIAAAVTRGEVNNLRVGKNAVFYDREGRDWDAVVTKVIDNPISIKQAFWSPYRKFWNWCTEKINKSAAEKDDKAFESLTAKADGATTAAAGGTTEKDKAIKQAFDIAKFAGIFAAIGMAIGYISAALLKVAEAVTGQWYYPLLLIAGLILVISGPSMFIAWSKLRRRNLAPVLNANGWAVNSGARISVPFGRTLTSEASFPRKIRNANRKAGKR